MIDKLLSKSKLNKLIEIFVRRVFYKHFSANLLTIIGLILGLLTAFLIFLSGIFKELNLIFIIISAIIMGISFFIDALDGTMARLKGITKFGGILDIFCDRTVEISIIIAFISTNPSILIWPGIFSLGSIVLCISMFLLVGGAIKAEDLEETKKVIYYRHGLMERSETFLFLLSMTLFYPWRFELLWLFAILVFITAFLRLRDAYILFKA